MIRDSGTGLKPRRTGRLKRGSIERKGPGWVVGEMSRLVKVRSLLTVGM